MKQKHFFLISVAVVFALIPTFVPSLLWIASVGALLGLGAIYPKKSSCPLRHLRRSG